MEEIVTAGPLPALIERLRELHGTVRRALDHGQFEQAAMLERERARLMHELFEDDFGLSAMQLREYAESLLDEQRELETMARSRRNGLTDESRVLHQARRASHAYRLEADRHAMAPHATTKEKP